MFSGATIWKIMQLTDIGEKEFFSNETYIIVISNENRLYVCKTQDLAYRPESIGQHGHNVRVRFVCWRCVTYSEGVGTLVPISENVNFKKYI